MDSLADYNNNPGNLKPPKGVTYEGQIGVDDKGFAIFENKEAGRTALINDIKTKIEKGHDNPEKFIDRYAPKGEENAEESRENYKIWMTHALGLKGTNEPFPENSAEKIADAITKFEGGTWNKAEEEKKPAEAAATDEGERLPSTNIQDIPGGSEGIKPALGVVGGTAGLGTAAGLETTKKVAPLLPNILNTVAGREVNINQPVSRMSLQRYLNSQIAPNLRLPLSELEKVSGAGKIRTMSEVQNALKAIQAVEEQRTAKPMVRMVPGRPGVFEHTGRFTTSVTPGTPGVDLTRYEVAPRGPVRQALAREASTAGEVGRAVAPSLGRIAAGGLGGAGAAMSGYDAYELYRKIQKDIAEGKEPSKADYARLLTKSMATAGGGLSMLPFGATQIGGLVLSAPELAWSGYEGLRDFAKKAASEERPDLGSPMGGLP